MFLELYLLFRNQSFTLIILKTIGYLVYIITSPFCAEKIREVAHEKRTKTLIVCHFVGAWTGCSPD
jgi:hypothetical protein